jgi:hypothetical protein
MIVYTRNRKVELLQAGGASLDPPVFLQPMTRVDIQFTADSVEKPLLLQGKTGAYVKVEVLDQPHTGKTGVLPLATLSEYAQNHLRTFGVGSNGITGNTYGQDVHLWDGNENSLWKKGALLWDGEECRLWELRCPSCGNEPEDHKLVESKMKPNQPYVAPEKTRPGKQEDKEKRSAMVAAPRAAGTWDDALLLYEKLLANARTRKGNTMFGATAKLMIGILHVAESDNVYAAVSGGTSGKRYQTAMSEAKPVVENLGFLWADGVDLPVLTRGGKKADASVQEEAQRGLVCAAPKLIQAAIRAGEWPYAMTEVYFNPNQEGDYPILHTIESCDRCRRTVPYMLCPD